MGSASGAPGFVCGAFNTLNVYNFDENFHIFETELLIRAYSTKVFKFEECKKWVFVKSSRTLITP